MNEIKNVKCNTYILNYEITYGKIYTVENVTSSGLYEIINDLGQLHRYDPKKFSESWD